MVQPMIANHNLVHALKSPMKTPGILTPADKSGNVTP